MGKLTAVGVRSLSKPGRYGDGGTLFLSIAPGGSKSWIQRVAVNGRRRDIGLGGWPLVTLAEARNQAFENRRLARRGGDPLADKQRAKAPTFREAALKTYEANRPRWRSAKTAVNWTQQLERHAFARIGSLRVDAISREDVLRILTPIWTAHPDIARKLRGRIRTVLAWAQAHGYVEHNTAGEGVDGALPAMPTVAAHYQDLPHADVAAALDIIEASQASVSAKACLCFVVLTACRSGEARGATWSEINERERLWVIPADRMKGGVEHRQPLSDAVVTLLARVRPLRDESDLLFPSPMRRGRPLSNMTLSKLLKEQGINAVPHGFRSSFRDWAAEKTNADHAVIELCLAHAVGSAVERAYRRSDLLAKRRRLMDQWAAFVTGGSAKVVAFNG